MKHCLLILSFFFTCTFTFGQDEGKLVISLEDILNTARSDAPRLQLEELRFEMQKARKVEASQWWLPEIFAGTQIRQLGGTTVNSDGRFFRDVELESFWAGIGLQAEWDFGIGTSNNQILQLETEMASEQMSINKNSFFLELIGSYFELHSAELNKRAYQSLIDESDDIIEQFQVRVDAGLAYESDLLLLKSNHQSLLLEQLNTEEAREIARLDLLETLSLSPMTLVECKDSLLAPLNPEALGLNSILGSDPQFDHPKLRQLEFQKQVSIAEKKAITRAIMLPSLYVNGYTSVFGGIFDPLDPTSEYNAGVMWRIPIDVLIGGGVVKQSNIQMEIAEQEKAINLLEINSNVEQDRIKIALSKKRIEIAKLGVEYTFQALDQSVQRQNNGTGRPLEVIRAQEQYLKSRLDHVNSIAAYNLNQYKLWVDLGNNF